METQSHFIDFGESHGNRKYTPFHIGYLGNIINYGELTKAKITRKLICLGTDGATIFQSLRIGVIMQMKYQHAPFLISMNYITLSQTWLFRHCPTCQSSQSWKISLPN
jgi:hypothetical protein